MNKKYINDCFKLGLQEQVEIEESFLQSYGFFLVGKNVLGDGAVVLYVGLLSWMQQPRFETWLHKWSSELTKTDP